MMEVKVKRDPRLPAGSVGLPGGELGEGMRLRFGCVEVEGRPLRAARGELRLAPDLWERLAVPYEEIRLSLRRAEPQLWELGPSLAVLYAGSASLPRREVEERADYYYGHLAGRPGLFAFGFDEAIDWARGTMNGYVVDNRPGRAGAVRPATFPIPAAVRLTWSIARSVIDQLRTCTGDRTFNWVRSLSKWRFFQLMHEEPDLRPFLPETRRARGDVALAAMLAKHREVFVKHVHGIKGAGSARVSLLPSGLAVTHVDHGRLVEVELPDLAAVKGHLDGVIGSNLRIVQQAIPIKGRQGRSLHVRVMTVQRPDGEWYVPIATAIVATDPAMIFTNVAHGGRDEDLLESLMIHHGMSQQEAEACQNQMLALALAVSRKLGRALHPLGLLGIDIAVDADSHRLWLFEANSVPGWGYDLAVEMEIARSQVDYGLSLQ
jgi:hypothetical protein